MYVILWIINNKKNYKAVNSMELMLMRETDA